jgi:(2R)-3-sulfolactate dehydrogenase (NADP+)
MEAMVKLTLDEALALCEAAAMRAGASPQAARSLAASAVDAEAAGQPQVGLAHFIDYLKALEADRMKGAAEPSLSRPAPAIILSDADGGAAHTGFDLAFEDIVSTARSLGLALFSQRNAYTCGALGYFAGRLAGRGLVSLAATNGPALLAPPRVAKPVYCTNPMAFAAPLADGTALLIDQSSSATAFVNIRRAARDGASIPEGWAIGADGRPTTDAREAVKGALVTFGGERGANIALMVEMLAAGLSGSNWSLDAPSFTSGAQSPGTGLFVLAIEPKLIDPDFETRSAAQVVRLEQRYGVHVPGRTRAESRRRAAADGVSIARETYDRIAGTQSGPRGA